MNKTLVRGLLSILLLGICAMNFGNALWINAKARLAQHLIESSWTTTLDTGSHQIPWSWADTWPVARLRHSRSNTDLVVLSGADGSSLAFGPGHLSGTASPGEGVSVIGGHRDTHFRFLKEVRLKDELFLQGKNGNWQRYVIDVIETVNSEKEPLMLPIDENRLILITCYPFDSWIPGGPMRYIVEARLIPT